MPSDIESIDIAKDLTPRNKILLFESMLAKHPQATFGDSVNCPLKHSFGDGVYVREIFIPKGTMLTGKIHRHAHPNFLMMGEVTVFTEEGGSERLIAPYYTISKAGTKRVVYAHEDSCWVTIHVTEETDLEKIEKIVIVESYEMLENEQKAQLRTGESQCLG